MIALVILIYVILIYVESVSLYRQKHWRDFWVNCTITLLSFVIAVLLSLGIEIPSPANPIKNVIKLIVGK